MYKSILFTIIAVFTFIILCVTIFFQCSEMKEYGMFYKVVGDMFSEKEYE